MFYIALGLPGRNCLVVAPFLFFMEFDQQDMFFFMGLGLVFVGLWVVWPPLALVVGGVGLMVVGYMGADDGDY